MAQAYCYAAERIARTDEFEPPLVSALQRAQARLIEIMLNPQGISARATLDAITQAALELQEDCL